VRNLSNPSGILGELAVQKQKPYLSLGTAILKDDYGVSRKSQNLTDLDKKEFLRSAHELGILHFDTAPGYGNAEKTIGEAFEDKNGISITSKVSRSSCDSFSVLVESVNSSLSRLNAVSLDSLLLHDVSVLRGESGVQTYRWLIQVKEMGLTKRIGVSVYSEDELLWVKEQFPEFMSFQLPESIMNRRSINSQELLRLHEVGNRLEVRSIFLQGLLLLDINALPKFFLPVRHLFLEFWNSLAVNEISALEACITYSKSIPWASGIVVGAEDIGQLLEIVGFFASERTLNFSSLPVLPQDFLDPRMWRT
jgi:aryl-alcohol dehydrogenase-like predicted oxidoreductase